MEKLEIRFWREVNTLTFESLLKRFYKSSKQKSTSKVLFDFKEVEWCEPFQLSLIVLWISELRDRDKKVVFIPPYPEVLPSEKRLSSEERINRIGKRIAVYSYFVECLFIDFLLKKKILSENDLEGYQSKRKSKSFESRISPFIFFSVSSDFRNFMRILYDQYRLQFAPVLDLDIVKSGEIRDMIIKELGENIFDHADGKFGHLLMSFRSPLDGNNQDRVRLREVRIVTAPVPERSFFSKLGDYGYLSVVISDKGLGIQRTIRSAYDLDHIIEKKKETPTEYDLIAIPFYSIQQVSPKI